MQFIRRINNQTLIRNGEQDSEIYGISYNSESDELFVADCNNKVVRSIFLHDDFGNWRDVYRAQHDMLPDMPHTCIWSVCYMKDWDTLLVCSFESGPDQKSVHWLVAFKSIDSDWREVQRVQTKKNGDICCALSDSLVLIGGSNSTYMELFRIECGPHIERVHLIHVSEEYYWFSSKCGSDTLVAMSYKDKSVRVHRLIGDRLEKLACIELACNEIKLLWLDSFDADLLIVSDWDDDKHSHAVVELELSGSRLERRSELIASSEKINVRTWCAMDDFLVIVDSIGDLLDYSF